MSFWISAFRSSSNSGTTKLFVVFATCRKCLDRCMKDAGQTRSGSWLSPASLISCFTKQNKSCRAAASSGARRFRGSRSDNWTPRPCPGKPHGSSVTHKANPQKAVSQFIFWKKESNQPIVLLCSFAESEKLPLFAKIKVWGTGLVSVSPSFRALIL